VAINGKPKYTSVDGVPFQCRLLEWRPDNRYTPQEIADQLQLGLAPAGKPKKPKMRSVQPDSISHGIGNDANDVLPPKAAENPVVAGLKARGLYKTLLGSGKHGMTCPWVHEHTDELDTGTAYCEPDELYPLGVLLLSTLPPRQVPHSCPARNCWGAQRRGSAQAFNPSDGW
jgi:hypothetical protein